MELNVLSAGCIPGDILWSWGIVLTSSLILLSLFLFILCCPSSYSCLLLWFLFFLLFVCLFMLSCTAVCSLSPTYLPTMWDHGWKYGEFWVQALSGSLLVCMLHWIQQCALPSLFYLSSVFCFLFNSFPCTMFYSQCKSLFSCIPSLYQTISQMLPALVLHSLSYN